MGAWKSIKQEASDVVSGKSTALSNVEKSLKLISEHEEFKAIIATTSERALKRAKEIDQKIAKGESVGELAGVPFIAKDNFLVFGADTTAASNILKGFDAPYQATAIKKLEEAGAICVAKANLDAFAHGSSTENSDFFTTINPVDKSRVPGGSSGGSAAAVALQLAPFALGTDTGGSIRLPASFCGVVGYKPTYGIVSRSGVVAMGSSLDVIGPLTQTVEDAGIVLEVISGKDGLDSTLIDRAEKNYDHLDSVDLKGLRVGVVKEYFDEGLDPAIRKNIERVIDQMKKSGATIEEVSLPSSKTGLAVYYVLCPAEVSSNLSRYDGQRYGYSNKEANDLDESYTKSRGKGFGSEAKRRIMVGTYVLSSGYYDAYYQKAQLVRTKIIQEFEDAFDKVDILIGPTAPMNAFKIGENIDDPLKMYLTDIMTVSANLAGIPAITIPAGLVDNLPSGVQLMAPQNKDKFLLSIAQKVEDII